MKTIRTDALKTNDKFKLSYLIDDSSKRYARNRFQNFSRRNRAKNKHFFAQEKQFKNQKRAIPFGVWPLHQWYMVVAKHKEKYNQPHQKMRAESKEREKRNEPYRNQEAIERVMNLIFPNSDSSNT